MHKKSEIELNVDSMDLPRVKRQLGMPLNEDLIVDRLGYIWSKSLANALAMLCRTYRKIRPKFIGNRCAFEPSCSRYAELCLRNFGLKKALSLSFDRLKRCRANAGGLDMPPFDE